MSKVSIIIPCYNQARYLAEAVRSALAQTHVDREIIIVNDGSPDDTAVVAKSLQAEHPGAIQYVEQENRGLAMARQAGFERAAGEWIVFLDADDLLEPAMAAILLGEQSRSGADVIAGSALLVDEANTRVLGTLRPQLPCAWPDVLRSNPIGAVHSALARRDAIIAVGGAGIPDARACEDWDLWARMIRCRMRFARVDAPVCRYRQHEGTLSGDPRLMLGEKFKLLDRMHPRDDRLPARLDPLPCVSEADFPRIRDGHLFYALGGAIALGLNRDAAAEMLENYGGSFDYRPFTDQFLNGARHVLRSRDETTLDLSRAEPLLQKIASTLAARGHARHINALLREWRRELADPFRARSLRRRLSRCLDWTRRFRS